MTEAKKIVIAEDHKILRQGLRLLLSLNSEIEIVGEAQNGFEAIELVKSEVPDLVLMDLSMPMMDGFGAIQEIKKISPATKILVLTVHRTEKHIQSALTSGADGYILKDAAHGELALAIQNILSGHSYVSPLISEYLVGFESVESKPTLLCVTT